MSEILPILLPVLLIAVVSVLFVGVFAMSRGGEFNRKWGNKLMQLRVLLQFAALIAILLTLLLAGG